MGKSYKPFWVFTAACLGMLIFGVVFISLGTINTFIQEKFRLDALSAGSLASTLPFGILLGSVIFGPVADRYGYKILLTASTLMILISIEAIAFAWSLTILQTAFFLIGFGGGMINGGTNALASDITDQGKGAKLSLLGIFFGIGALGMPLLMGLLIRFWEYGTIFSVIGGCILLPVLYFITITFPEPKQKQGFPLKQGIQLFKNPLIIFSGLILFFESGIEGIVSNWTTSYLKNAAFTSENALFALSVQILALIIGRLVLSRILKYYSPFLSFFVCIVLIFTGSIVLLNAASYFYVILAMILLGAGFAAGFPVILGLTGERFPGISGTAFSLVIVIALIGNIVMNYLTGIMADTSGIKNFPLLLAACSVCMAGLLFTIRKEFENNK